MRVSFVGSQVLHMYAIGILALCIGGLPGEKQRVQAHLVEVDTDTADVGRTYGNHPKEPISPSPEHYDTKRTLVSFTIPFLTTFKDSDQADSQVTLSFKTNRSCILFAMYGLTLNRSPVKCLRFSTTQLVGEWNRW